MHCRPLYSQGLTVLRSNTQPSNCPSTRSNHPFPIGKQEREPTLCIGRERHCSWSLRLSQIYESLEISRRGEDGWRTTEHSVHSRTDGLCRDSVAFDVISISNGVSGHLLTPEDAAWCGRPVVGRPRGGYPSLINRRQGSPAEIPGDDLSTRGALAQPYGPRRCYGAVHLGMVSRTNLTRWASRSYPY